jgi:hypothetical protein
MRVLTNLKDKICYGRSDWRLCIGASYSTKSRVISRGFVPSERDLIYSGCYFNGFVLYSITVTTTPAPVFVDCTTAEAATAGCHQKAKCVKSSASGSTTTSCVCNPGYSGDGTNSCNGEKKYFKYKYLKY